MTQPLLSRRTLGEGAITSVGVVANAALAFLITWLVSRHLGAAGSGYFFVLTSVFVIATSAIGLGADTALMRTLSRQQALGRHTEFRASITVAVVPVIVAGGALTLVLLGQAHSIADVMGLPAEYVPALRWAGAFVLPASLLGILLGGCRGLGRLHTYSAIQNLAVPVLRVAGVGTVLWMAPGVIGVTAAWVAPLGMALVATIVLLRRYVAAAVRTSPLATAATASAEPHRHRLDGALEFWRFSLPRGAAVLIERAIDWADVLLVFHLLGPAAGGVYGVVSRCAMAGQFLESAMRIVAGPRISAALALEDHRRIGTIFTLVTRLLVLGLWPCYLILAVFSDRVLALFGPEFVAGAPALSIVCLAMMCASAAGMLQTFLLMGGRSHWQLMNRLAHLAVLVTLTGFLAPRLGLTGAALAWASGILVDTTLAATQVRRSIGAHTRLREVGRSMMLPLLLVGGGSILIRLTTANASLGWLISSVLLLGGTYLALTHHLRQWIGLPAMKESTT